MDFILIGVIPRKDQVLILIIDEQFDERIRNQVDCVVDVLGSCFNLSFEHAISCLQGIVFTELIDSLLTDVFFK